MASTYSPKLRFELIGAGEQAGLWGTTTNKNIGQLIEQAIAGVSTVELDGVSGNYTLTALDGAPDQSRSAVILCTYAAVPASGAINLIIPTQTKLYVVRNECGQTITVKTSAQTGGVQLLNGEATLVFCDGAIAEAGIETATVGTLTVSGGGTGSTTFTAGFVKSPGGTGALTSSSTVALASEVSGTLPVANGGTGATTFTSGALLKGAGTGAVSTASAADIVSAIGTTAVARATNVAGGAANRIPYNTAADTTGFIVAPTVSSTYLQWNGTAFVWSAVSGGVSSITGTANQVVASASTGAVTLSLPQSIATSSDVQFGGLGVGTAGTAGQIRSTGNITAYFSSDVRLKENVKDIESATDKVVAIGGKTFDWKDEYIVDSGGEDGYFIQKSDFGVIAQDVQKVFPVAVRTREDGTLAVDYEKLVALAFAAIKELSARVKELESK